jgi:hypothetical protein
LSPATVPDPPICAAAATHCSSLANIKEVIAAPDPLDGPTPFVRTIMTRVHIDRLARKPHFGIH